VGGFLDRGERSLESDPGRGHDDSDGDRIRVCDFGDDAAPAVPDLYRCVFPRVLHLRFPRGGGIDDGPRNASLGKAPGPGATDSQVLTMANPCIVRGDERSHSDPFSGVIFLVLIPSPIRRGRVRVEDLLRRDCLVRRNSASEHSDAI